MLKKTHSRIKACCPVGIVRTFFTDAGRTYICLSDNVKTGHSIRKQVTFILIVN